MSKYNLRNLKDKGKKILIIGHARHGKDTVAEFMRDLYGFKFESSSAAAARIFLFEALKHKYNYQSYGECFEDRINHRAEWYQLICEYNKNDRARLAKDILKDGDIYVGMRDDSEIEVCKYQGVFDFIIGVYDPRKPLESADSFNIDLFKYSDIIIENSGSLSDLSDLVRSLGYGVDGVCIDGNVIFK
jgi:dephospho-CoA kinase